MSADKQKNEEMMDQVEGTEQEMLEDEHKGEEKLESPEINADSLEAQLEQAQAKASRELGCLPACQGRDGQPTTS